jgi:hypothetical protein
VGQKSRASLNDTADERCDSPVSASGAGGLVGTGTAAGAAGEAAAAVGGGARAAIGSIVDGSLCGARLYAINLYNSHHI